VRGAANKGDPENVTLYFRKIRGREAHATPLVSTSYMISLLYRLYFFCSLPPSVFV